MNDKKHLPWSDLRGDISKFICFENFVVSKTVKLKHFHWGEITPQAEKIDLVNSTRWIGMSSKVAFVGLPNLPKIRGKPKATTKVTQKSHQWLWTVK